MLIATRQSALLGLLCLSAWTAFAEVGQAANTPHLFHIGRSKNRNVVNYDVRLDRSGKLLAADPVDAYWRLYAEDGRREELGLFERKLAYGFATERVTPDGFVLRLKAFTARQVRVRRQAERYRAELVIGGRRAILKRIFVSTSEGVVPSVRSIDLYGTDAETGTPLSERLLPD